MRKIPPAVVQRLRKVAPKLERQLKKLPIVDHRTVFSPGAVRNDPLFWGGRVRQLNASRSFSEPIVLKRVHPLRESSRNDHHHTTAPLVIRAIVRTVRNYRQQFKDHMETHRYHLIETPAVAISDTLIAMARTNAPALEEFDWHMRPAANNYLKRVLGDAWNGYQNSREAYTPLVRRIRRVGEMLRVRLRIEDGGDNDIFFMGIDKKGYLVYMLTADVQSKEQLIDKNYPGREMNDSSYHSQERKW